MVLGLAQAHGIGPEEIAGYLLGCDGIGWPAPTLLELAAQVLGARQGASRRRTGAAPVGRHPSISGLRFRPGSSVEIAGGEGFLEFLSERPLVLGNIFQRNPMKNRPSTKNTRKDPVMPTVSTRIGKLNAMIALVTQRISTHSPIPKPRIRSGNSSERQTQTGTFSANCMKNTKATTNTRIA